MHTGGFAIGPQLDLEAVEPLVVDAFVTQRRRLLDSARTLDAAEWSRPSRCAAWNTRELLLHVLGATDACRTTLTGEHSVFGGSFDPNSSPNRFVERRAADPVATTLDELATSITATAAVIEAQRGRVPTPRATAVWAEAVDWRLFVTHFFWDGWMHERDLLVPLGREPVVSDAETRLAAAYGFHSAGIMIGLLGPPLDVTLHLDGTGRGTYRIEVDGLDVRISVRPPEPGDGPSNGTTIPVVDALAGRGTPLGSVLDAPLETVDAFSQLGAFLQGDAAPPPVPGR